MVETSGLLVPNKLRGYDDTGIGIRRGPDRPTRRWNTETRAKLCLPNADSSAHDRCSAIRESFSCLGFCWHGCQQPCQRTGDWIQLEDEDEDDDEDQSTVRVALTNRKLHAM
ncbi:GD23980 [Drosophila simulans]|uniref:GD23980 n=1 Tax=Drosophila simulans TaxID=7240 RepID=B4Q5X0_DROSI|nr:GD23980 [Drosophila simulans]